jgi:hypothetical protein
MVSNSSTARDCGTHWPNQKTGIIAMCRLQYISSIAINDSKGIIGAIVPRSKAATGNWQLAIGPGAGRPFLVGTGGPCNKVLKVINISR